MNKVYIVLCQWEWVDECVELSIEGAYSTKEKANQVLKEAVLIDLKDPNTLIGMYIQEDLQPKKDMESDIYYYDYSENEDECWSFDLTLNDSSCIEYWIKEEIIDKDV